MTSPQNKPSRLISLLRELARPRLGEAALLLAVSAMLTVIMALYIDFIPSNIQAGNIAASDIRADQNYELVDEKSTNKLKEEAVANVMPVYDFDTGLVLSRVEDVRKGFSEARERVRESGDSAAKSLPEDDEIKLRQDFQLALGVALTDSDYAAVRQDGFSEELEQALVTLLEPVQKQAIVEDEAELLARGEKGVVFRTGNAAKPDLVESNLYEYGAILSRKEAEAAYEGQSVSDIQKQHHLEFLDADAVRAARALLPKFIKANVTLNKTETDLRRERAKNNIQNIIYKLQKGQIIIRRGDRYEPWHITVLEGIRNARRNANIAVQLAGAFLLVLTTTWVLYVFGGRHVRRFRPSRKDNTFLALMLVSFMAFLRLGSFMATGLRENMPFSVDIATLYYLIPVAAGPMIVRYILNAETALLFGVSLSFFSGVFLENSLEIAVYYLVSGLYGAHLIGYAERRSTVFRCGLLMGLLNAALVVCLALVDKISLAAAVDAQALLIKCLFAFAGGIVNSLVMLAFSPVVESLFNYTTNIQLLELANMNHPLLREMIVRAPGTYHHSQLVGILAEAGARAVRGNALLARVGSYYHDIGKMKKPLYFIENQKGDNPHDRLAPTMSALIIEAHVKDGLDMAKEYNLPKAIVDFIPEHQGTKLIGYFYNKAKKLADPNSGKVDERDFRYKGPLPQSRESGIVMLADTVEAAVRSMSEKSPQKIHATVEKLVNMHFVDGQLNQCDLTLRDLHLIVDAFVKILAGIYHQRVEYPDQHVRTPIKTLSPDIDAGGYNPYERKAPDNISPLFRDKR